MHKRWEPWLLIAPGMLLFVVFGFAPVLMGLAGSVVDMGYYGTGWIGFQAVVDVFTWGLFWHSVKTTLLFVAVLLPATFALTMTAAVVLSWARSELQALGRLAFYVPSVVSVMMITFVWDLLLRPNGAVNRILGTDILWIASNPYAFWSLSVMTVPIIFGGWLVIMMAAFSSIDTQLYEAAKLDGCTRVQEAWHITMPGIRPVITYAAVMMFSGYLQFWEIPYSMTGGGPNYGTTTIMLLIYQEAVLSGHLPQASVMSMFLLVMVMGSLGLYRLVSGRRLLF